MKKIPTAEDFMNSKEFEPDSGISFEDYHGDNAAMVPHMMIEFAKLHVQAALKTANQHATASNKSKFSGDCNPVVDSDSILNAYPLENIK